MCLSIYFFLIYISICLFKCVLCFQLPEKCFNLTLHFWCLVAEGRLAPMLQSSTPRCCHQIRPTPPAAWQQWDPLIAMLRPCLPPCHRQQQTAAVWGC